MAVTVNSTSGGEGTSKLFVGVAPLAVVAVNPSQQQLQELGYKAEKAPNYRDEKSGQRVAFYCEGTVGQEKIKTNITFFLKDKKIETLFINKQGSFAKDRTKVEGEVRNPFDGEVGLIDFIKTLVGSKKGQEVVLDTIEQIVKTGDVEELRQIVEKAKNNKIKGYLTVRQGKYQGVYQKKFEREYSGDFSYLHRSLAENREYLKEDLGDFDFAMYKPIDFKLREWTGEFSTVAANAAATASSNGHASTGSAGDAPAVDTSDDLPF